MEEERSRSPSKYRVVLSPDAMSKKTHFSSDEVSSLVSLHKEVTREGKMDRLRFREAIHTLFDLTDDVMLDRIFRAFDINNDTIIDEHEWVLGLSVFLRGTLEEQINFAYFCYDINGDRSLARDELFHCLKHCLIKTSTIEEDVEESVKEIVEIAMRKLDMDKNGQITFPDFQAAVVDDPLLLEACGPCLPTPMAVASFFIHLKEKYENGSSGSSGRIMGGMSGTKRKRLRRASSYNVLME